MQQECRSCEWALEGHKDAWRVRTCCFMTRRGGSATEACMRAPQGLWKEATRQQRNSHEVDMGAWALTSR